MVLRNPYGEFVAGFSRLLAAGADLVPAPEPPRLPLVRAGAPKVLLFSPHPDDECLTGALPLRLRRERGMNVINVAVTLGSNPARCAARRREVSDACAWLGFGLLTAATDGLKRINPATRGNEPSYWQTAVATIAAILAEQQPTILFVPHRDDRHPTHVGTHHLVFDALAQLAGVAPAWIVETEYWAPLVTPNLMVGSSVDDVADLVAALACHRGEVARNAYHLALPAGMIDAVRRGTELVKGYGTAAPACHFATLYRLSRRRMDAGIEACEEPLVIPAEADLGLLFAA